MTTARGGAKLATVIRGMGAVHRVGPGLVPIVLLSLFSAASYGIAAVLQHRAAIKEPPELGAGLLLRLVRRPLWLVGNLLDGVGYLFQFLALRRGSLALVEPMLVLSLVFALPAAAWLDHRRVASAEIGATVVVASGLALFLGVGRPGPGHPAASGPAWAVLSAIVLLTCLALALGSRGGSRRRAAVLLAGGSGVAFGYVAAVTERTGHLLDGGVVHVLSTWSPYALVVGAMGALVLTQSAFHAGALRLSLPTLTVAQPLVAVVIGIAFFGERIADRGVAPVLEVAGLVLVTVGVSLLARSPSIVAGEGDRR